MKRLMVALCLSCVLVGCSDESDAPTDGGHFINPDDLNLTQTYTVADGNFTVPAGTVTAFGWQFTGYEAAEIILDFEETTLKTTEIMLFTDIAYKNWLANADGIPLYDSGRVAAGRTTVTLSPSGNYVLAINNRWSILTSKTIRLSAVMTYQVKGLS